MKKTLGLLALAALVAGTAQAAPRSFRVSLDGIATGGTAPYSLNFQFAQGSDRFEGTTVTLNNFVFTGGGASGAADFSASIGNGASGSTGSGFTLHVGGTDAYSDILQGFTLGTASIAFDLTVDSLPGSIATPDKFSLFLLDSNFSVLTTDAADSSNAFLSFEVRGDSTLATMPAVSSSGSGVTATVTAVPEPSTYGLLGAGALAAVAGVRRRRQAA